MTRVQAEELLTLLEEWLDLREDVAAAQPYAGHLATKLEEADEARAALADKMVEVCS